MSRVRITTDSLIIYTGEFDGFVELTSPLLQPEEIRAVRDFLASPNGDSAIELGGSEMPNDFFFYHKKRHTIVATGNAMPQVVEDTVRCLGRRHAEALIIELYDGPMAYISAREPPAVLAKGAA